MNDFQHQVFFGDARDMSDIQSSSVQLVVTSPPYWQIKDYGTENQIGFHQTLPEYIESLNAVWRECFRVLADGCRLCVNIGDQFARAVHYGRYKVIPLHQEVIAGCEVLGFDYMGAIIWQKATTMNTSGGGAVMGSFPHPRNGILKIDYEFILLFKKLGKAPVVSPEQKAASAMTTEEWNRYFSGHWNFAGEKQGNGHIAVFPMELPRRLIKMFSFAGERVLDPFLGSGTTMRMAIELGRVGLGYEINGDFLPIIQKKLEVDENRLFTTHNISFEKSVATTPNAISNGAMKSSIERKVDAKQFRFNSIIEADDLSKPKTRGPKIIEVLQPNRLRIEDGGEVRLLGIAPRADKVDEALKYLRDNVLNKRVVLRFDQHIHDENGTPQAYVYLENKTFINAKLLKNQLAFADETAHHFGEKFRALQNAREEQNV